MNAKRLDTNTVASGDDISQRNFAGVCPFCHANAHGLYDGLRLHELVNVAVKCVWAKGFREPPPFLPVCPPNDQPADHGLQGALVATFAKPMLCDRAFDVVWRKFEEADVKAAAGVGREPVSVGLINVFR